MVSNDGDNFCPNVEYTFHAGVINSKEVWEQKWSKNMIFALLKVVETSNLTWQLFVKSK